MRSAARSSDCGHVTVCGLPVAGSRPTPVTRTGYPIRTRRSSSSTATRVGRAGPRRVRPFLRGTANVLGIDFRGHGNSDAGPSTFGMLEAEDIAGALAWLGERGIRRVALFGTSMGGMAAITAVAVLGDGRLGAAEAGPDAPRADLDAPRPLIAAVVADSASPEAELAVANRVGAPMGRFLAARAFDSAARRLGADPRDTEPIRVIGLVAPVPLLLINGKRIRPCRSRTPVVSRPRPGRRRSCGRSPEPTTAVLMRSRHRTMSVG